MEAKIRKAVTRYFEERSWEEIPGNLPEPDWFWILIVSLGVVTAYCGALFIIFGGGTADWPLFFAGLGLTAFGTFLVFLFVIARRRMKEKTYLQRQEWLEAHESEKGTLVQEILAVLPSLGTWKGLAFLACVFPDEFLEDLESAVDKDLELEGLAAKLPAQS